MKKKKQGERKQHKLLQIIVITINETSKIHFFQGMHIFSLYWNHGELSRNKRVKIKCFTVKRHRKLIHKYVYTTLMPRLYAAYVWHTICSTQNP